MAIVAHADRPHDLQFPLGYQDLRGRAGAELLQVGFRVVVGHNQPAALPKRAKSLLITLGKRSQAIGWFS